MLTPKQKYLEEEWKGWKYLWIKKTYPDDPSEYIDLHEAYKIGPGEKISYTERAVDPMAVPEILRRLADMLEDGVVYTEEEIEEYNRSVE